MNNSQFIDLVQTAALVAVVLFVGYAFLLMRKAVVGAVKMMSVVVERTRVLEEKAAVLEKRITELEAGQSSREVRFLARGR